MPPIGGEERMEEFPDLVPTEVVLSGDSWKQSSKDIAIAGEGASWLRQARAQALDAPPQPISMVWRKRRSRTRAVVTLHARPNNRPTPMTPPPRRAGLGGGGRERRRDVQGVGASRGGHYHA